MWVPTLTGFFPIETCLNPKQPEGRLVHRFPILRQSAMATVFYDQMTDCFVPKQAPDFC